MAAAALARLGLRAVKEVRVQFCPFENNVESTRTFLQAVSREKVRATNLKCSVIVDVRHDGSEPCVDVLFGDGQGNAHCLRLPRPGPERGGERGPPWR
ncbi:PREDICTED: 39S ribosomal protein L53, mitochondrial [Myotis davidii]|uniref:39S ribosomal protein L53, mitochondrial n=1 Tax=Myotis davidii TaxID=225400 RepID=UPI0003EC57D3|nr:PREDICTED: 39S ribosomal protein L53, mitochondrial [Myotis davidii]